MVDNNKFLLNVGGEQEFYCNPFQTPGCNPFSHSGSILTITASVPSAAQLASIKANAGFKASNYSSIGGPYISGAMHSGQVYKATYGYYEINCRQPAGPGAWTAFWMPNEVAGEMDFLEQAGTTGNEIGCGVHYTGSDGVGSGTQYHIVTQPNATSQFNTYGGLWTPNYVAFYFNGALIFSAPASYTGAVGGANTQFIINFALGNANGCGLASPAHLPISMDIDWVRCSVIGPA